MNKLNLRILAVGVAVLVGLPVAYYLLSPLWINVEVNESFPTAAPEVSVQATQAMSTAMAEPDKAMAEAMPAAEMRILTEGSFYNIIHVGSGQAILYQLADGSRLLRLQDFKVDNGPELHVYLVPIDPVPSSIGVEIPGSVDLGLLKGNIGDQNYEIPADLDLNHFKSVVIWCQPFRVPFIAAPIGVP